LLLSKGKTFWLTDLSTSTRISLGEGRTYGHFLDDGKFILDGNSTHFEFRDPSSGKVLADFSPPIKDLFPGRSRFGIYDVAASSVSGPFYLANGTSIVQWSPKTKPKTTHPETASEFLAISPDGGELAFYDDMVTVRFFQASDLGFGPGFLFSAGSKLPEEVVFSPTSRMVLLGTRDGAEIYSMKPWKRVLFLKL
jgi:hypothetical protein